MRGAPWLVFVLAVLVCILPGPGAQAETLHQFTGRQIRKRFSGRFSTSSNGEPLLTETDWIFIGLGKVALWTKAESVTHRDKPEIRPLQ